MGDKRVIILFDLDGTLIDSTEAIIESFWVAYEAFNIPKPHQNDITKHIGNPLSYMFKHTGAPDDINDAIVARYKEHYRTIANQKTYLLENAKDAVEIAASFARLGVVTTKTARYSKEILEHLGLLKHFETVVGFEDVQNPKPHAEPILKALSNMNANPSKDFYMIGDTRLDIEAANNAQIEHIAVYSGYEPEESLKKYSNKIEKDAMSAVLRIKNLLSSGKNY
ncbi:MAG: hypothetical protein RL154_1675 [Pseudomonadota bacterium]